MHNIKRPKGWPKKCAKCGASWKKIGWAPDTGFYCINCGGADSDET